MEFIEDTMREHLKVSELHWNIVGNVGDYNTPRKKNNPIRSLESCNYRFSNVEFVLFSSYSIGINYAKQTFIIQHTSNHPKMQHTNAKCPSPAHSF